MSAVPPSNGKSAPLPLILSGLGDAAVEHDVAAGEQGPRRRRVEGRAGRRLPAACAVSGQSATVFTRPTPKSDLSPQASARTPGPDRVGPQEREPLAVLREVRGERLGRARASTSRDASDGRSHAEGREDRVRLARRRARARRSACSSRRATSATSLRVVAWRSSGTGSPARSGPLRAARAWRPAPTGRRSATRRPRMPTGSRSSAAAVADRLRRSAPTRPGTGGRGGAAEAELTAGDGQRDGDREEAEDEQERTAFHRADADQRTEGRPVRAGGRGVGRCGDGGPDRIRTGDLQRDRLACWAATPRVHGGEGGA